MFTWGPRRKKTLVFPTPTERTRWFIQGSWSAKKPNIMAGSTPAALDATGMNVSVQSTRLSWHVNQDWQAASSETRGQLIIYLWSARNQQDGIAEASPRGRRLSASPWLRTSGWTAWASTCLTGTLVADQSASVAARSTAPPSQHGDHRMGHVEYVGRRPYDCARMRLGAAAGSLSLWFARTSSSPDSSSTEVETPAITRAMLGMDEDL